MKATTVTVSGHILVMLLTECKHKQRDSSNRPNRHSHFLFLSVSPWLLCSVALPRFPGSHRVWVPNLPSPITPQCSASFMCLSNWETSYKCIILFHHHYGGAIEYDHSECCKHGFKWLLMRAWVSNLVLHSLHCFKFPLHNVAIKPSVSEQSLCLKHGRLSSVNDMLSFVDTLQTRPVPNLAPLLNIFALFV